jgi:hypothetical protein
MQLSTGYNRRPRPFRVRTSDINSLFVDAVAALDDLKPQAVRAMALTNAREGRFDISDDATDHVALFDRGYDLIGHTAALFEVHTIEGEIAPMRYEAIQATRQALRTQAIAWLDARAKYLACRDAYRTADDHDRALLTMDGHAAGAHLQWNGWIFAGMVEAAVELFGADILAQPTDRAQPAKRKTYEKGVLAVENVLGERHGHSREQTRQVDSRPRPPVDGYDQDEPSEQDGCDLVLETRTSRVLHTFAELKELKDAGEIIMRETGERPTLEDLSLAAHEDEDACTAAEIAAIYAEATSSTGTGAAALGFTDEGRPDGWHGVQPAHASAIVEA